VSSVTTAEIEPARPGDSASTHAVLVLAFSDGGRGEPERSVLPGDGLVLGRDTPLFSAGLKDATISRRHAEIRAHHGRFRLCDLGSRNGSFVNGQRITGDHALDPGDVVRIGATLLVYTRAADEPVDDREAAPNLIGASDAIARVRRSIGLVAGQRLAVLVTGETGTGKELVAQALHARGRRGGPLVSTNCAGFSKEMLASELFGHVRGAFTGAVSNRPGLFRSAHGGTLFLDELGELPLDLQAQLLRVLEAGHVRPVGGTGEVPVDVAVVGATHRDLLADVREQRFRADLYGRLVQWRIEVPPLRDRRDDIPWLLRHLLARCDAEQRRLTFGLTEALLLHPWPLNVRGLLNVIAIAVLASRSHPVLDLHPEVVAALEAARTIAEGLPDSGGRPSETAVPGSASGGKGRALPADAIVEKALVDSRGSVAIAARSLGASRQQLYRWLEQRDLHIESFRAG
jgi:transcriptional regulator with GAF, ATPase, and Fis domain